LATSNPLAVLGSTSSLGGASAADAVYGILREAITSGQLEAGVALVEEQVARQVGVSRTPVREALLRLESEGLALRVPRRGLVVRALSEHEVREVYAVRAALEALAGRWAASEALPSDIAHLRLINQRLREAMSVGQAARIPLLTNEFHQALGAAAHNGMLSRFIMQCQDWTRRVGTSTVALPARTAAALDEHERLIDAIEARDADAAERLAREHISTGRQFQLAVLRERHRLQA
jgi:DNA-binding GntR family transcriptional regulator